MQSRILIVEDDPLVSMMLEDCLAALGREPVGPFDNVIAALAKIEEGNVDAAIVDVHLANGETSEAIVGRLNERGVAFVITTGGFIAPPGSAYANHPILHKPFTISSLEKVLDEIDRAQKR